jgi:hypothetical protein
VKRWEERLFWWFERGGQFLRYEVNDRPEGGYVLRIIDADGTERSELFDDSTELSKRQVEFERELTQKGWTGPHGWNL